MTRKCPLCGGEDNMTVPAKFLCLPEVPYLECGYCAEKLTYNGKEFVPYDRKN